MFMVGVGGDTVKTMPIDPTNFSLWRKTLQGVLFGDAQFRADIPRYMEMYENGQIDLDTLVTHEFKLDDINTCFENVMAGNKVGRQVIRYGLTPSALPPCVRCLLLFCSSVLLKKEL